MDSQNSQRWIRQMRRRSAISNRQMLQEIGRGDQQSGHAQRADNARNLRLGAGRFRHRRPR
jgi:hypothetical protein